MQQPGFPRPGFYPPQSNGRPMMMNNSTTSFPPTMSQQPQQQYPPGPPSSSSAATNYYPNQPQAQQQQSAVPNNMYPGNPMQQAPRSNAPMMMNNTTTMNPRPPYVAPGQGQSSNPSTGPVPMQPQPSGGTFPSNTQAMVPPGSTNPRGMPMNPNVPGRGVPMNQPQQFQQPPQQLSGFGVPPRPGMIAPTNQIPSTTNPAMIPPSSNVARPGFMPNQQSSQTVPSSSAPFPPASTASTQNIPRPNPFLASQQQARGPPTAFPGSTPGPSNQGPPTMAPNASSNGNTLPPTTIPNAFPRGPSTSNSAPPVSSTSSAFPPNTQMNGLPGNVPPRPGMMMPNQQPSLTANVPPTNANFNAPRGPPTMMTTTNAPSNMLVPPGSTTNPAVNKPGFPMTGPSGTPSMPNMVASTGPQGPFARPPFGSGPNVPPSSSSSSAPVTNPFQQQSQQPPQPLQQTPASVSQPFGNQSMMNNPNGVPDMYNNNSSANPGTGNGFPPPNTVPNMHTMPGMAPGSLAPTSVPGGSVPMAEVNEQHQCSPTYMTLTMGAFPRDANMVNKSALPFGVCVHPLAECEGSLKGQIPLVNFGSAGVIRCKRCRAYINPFAKFLDAGRRWRCNFCSYVNDVPTTYFAPTDENNNRLDIAERPELNSGSVEFVAPVEYMVRAPQPPVYVFVLDVSFTAIQTGMLQAAVDGIKQSLDRLPGDTLTQVGFVTFDTSVHFYELKSSLKTPRVLVVPDVDDLFLPAPQDLLVNLSESRALVDTLLNTLPGMFSTTRNMEAALGPAIDGAYQIMQHIGGKMVISSACLPTAGPGKLKVREGPRMLGSDKEHTLLAPDTTEDGGFYKAKAVDFSKQQISVDLFVLAANYADIATLGAMSRYTAGQVYYYPTLALSTDRERLTADMCRDLTRRTGFEAVIRVRCTAGLSVTNFYGNFFIRGTDLLVLPNVTPDTAFNVELAHTEALAPGSVMAVQCAVLYTTSFGERRICVHTFAKPVTTQMTDLYRNVDSNAVVNMLAKVSLDQALRTGLPMARRYLHRAVVELIRAWRACQSSPYGLVGGMVPTSGMMSRMPTGPSATPQALPTQASPTDIMNMLPEALQLIPLLSMGLQKSTLYRGGEFIRSDERVYLVYRMLSMPISLSRKFIYPNLYSLHDMDNTVGRPDGTNTILSPDSPFAGPSVTFPPTLTVSATSLVSTGFYLLDNGQEIYLWFGKDVPGGLLSALFGIPSLQGIDTSTLQLVDQNNDYCTRVLALIRACRATSSSSQRVRIVKEGAGDVNEARFHWHMIEDRQQFQGGTITYAEYSQIVLKESQMAQLGGISGPNANPSGPAPGSNGGSNLLGM